MITKFYSLTIVNTLNNNLYYYSYYAKSNYTIQKTVIQVILYPVYF